MTSHLPLRIIDTPLVDNKSWRTATLERMVAILIREETAGNKEDAVATLRAEGFDIVDIYFLLDDARQAAFQQTIEVVEREMAKP